MQAILDRWNARRSSAVPPELIGRIAPPARKVSTCTACSASPSSNTPSNCYRRGGIKITGRPCLKSSKLRRELHLLQQTAEPTKSRSYGVTPRNLPRKRRPAYRHFWHANQGEAI